MLRVLNMKFHVYCCSNNILLINHQDFAVHALEMSFIDLANFLKLCLYTYYFVCSIMQVSKQFFPHLAVGFEDPRVSLHIGDGQQHAMFFAYDGGLLCIIICLCGNDCSRKIGYATFDFNASATANIFSLFFLSHSNIC